MVEDNLGRGPSVLAIAMAMLLAPACSPAEEADSNSGQSVDAAASAHSSQIMLDPSKLAGLPRVVVEQPNDSVFNRPVKYVAVPFDQLIKRLYPDWQEMQGQDYILVLRAAGDYAPMVSFNELISGKAFIAERMAEKSPTDPYDCWDEGGMRHCDLGYFVIWNDGIYPQRAQPWGLKSIEAVRYGQALAPAIPKVEDAGILSGFALYQKYCIECHSVNFVGGSKATEHVARPAGLTVDEITYFTTQYRRSNPDTYMPDFSTVLNQAEIGKLAAYLDHMHRNENACHAANRPARCD